MNDKSQMPGFPNSLVSTLTGHEGPIHALAFSAGTGQYVMTLCHDHRVQNVT